MSTMALSGGVGHEPAARQWWRAAVPLLVIAAIALLPAPAGLAAHTWYYFAIFAGVIASRLVMTVFLSNSSPGS